MVIIGNRKRWFDPSLWPMPDRRILITGGRKFAHADRIHAYLERQLAIAKERGEALVVVHGAHPRGADRIASDWTREMVKLGAPVREERHAADWSLEPKAAGRIRNQHMVTKGAIECGAFPDRNSRGTWDCVRRAEKAGIVVVVDRSEVTSR